MTFIPDTIPIRREVKLWGETTVLYSNNFSEVVVAQMVAGGYTSMHRHLKKDNHFVVLRGEIVVSMAVGLVVITKTLSRGDSLTVPAGRWHRVSSLKASSEFLETYTPDGRNGFVLPDDIERQDIGGVMEA